MDPFINVKSEESSGKVSGYSTELVGYPHISWLEEAEEGEEEVITVDFRAILSILSIVSVFFRSSLRKTAFGDFVFEAIGFGNLGCLVYLTLLKLYCNGENLMKGTWRDITVYMSLLLHLLMITFLT